MMKTLAICATALLIAHGYLSERRYEAEPSVQNQQFQNLILGELIKRLPKQQPSPPPPRFNKILHTSGQGQCAHRLGATWLHSGLFAGGFLNSPPVLVTRP